MIKEHPGRTINRKRYGQLRNCVRRIKKKHPNQDWVGEDFHWPDGPLNSEAPTDSYSSIIHNELIDACLKDVKNFKKWMDEYASNVKHAPTIQGPDSSIFNIMHELRISKEELQRNGERKPTHRWFEWAIRSRKSVKEYIKQNGITIKEFLEIYRSSLDELADKGRPINGTKVTDKGVIEKHEGYETTQIVIATVGKHHPAWPMEMSLLDAQYLFSQKWGQDNSEPGNKTRSLHMKTYKAMMSMKLVSGNNVVEVGQMAYFSSVTFTLNTLFPFLLLLLIQTGWNLETLLSLTDDLDDHIEPDLIDSDYVIIHGMKKRGAINSGNEAIPQYHRSNKRDKLGAYQLLLFIQKHVTKHKDSPHYIKGKLFQFVVSKNLWMKFGKISSALDYDGFANGSAAFLNRHGLHLGNNTVNQRLEVRKLRTTFETKRRQQGFDIDEVSLQMGHANVDTTLRHYDSDGATGAILDDRIRALQNRQVSDIRNYGANILSDMSLIELRAALDKTKTSETDTTLEKLVERLKSTRPEIITLLSPAGQTYIASCLDAKAPDWPGSALFVNPGEKCTYFNKCPLCTRCVLFREALPYIFRRIFDLDNLRERINLLQWNLNYQDEYTALIEILSKWSNSEDIDHAQKVYLESEYYLPLTMRGAI
ncbi:TPA: hypothetical protein ACQQJD_004905 [Pseudomonas aeruginosa]